VPECSNLSIGYAREHSTFETLDIEYLEALIARLCAIDWEALPVVRDPLAADDEFDLWEEWREQDAMLLSDDALWRKWYSKL